MSYMLAVERRNQDFVPAEEVSAEQRLRKNSFSDNGKAKTSGYAHERTQAARSRRLPTGRRSALLRRLITNCFGTGSRNTNSIIC